MEFVCDIFVGETGVADNRKNIEFDSGVKGTSFPVTSGCFQYVSWIQFLKGHGFYPSSLS
jgi:hypothetical protein